MVDFARGNPREYPDARAALGWPHCRRTAGALSDRLAVHREQLALRVARGVAVEGCQGVYVDALTVCDLDAAIALLDTLARDAVA